MPSAQFFESILESLSAGIVTADADGRIAHVDNSFCDAVGADKETLRGVNLFDALVPAHSRADAREVFRERLGRPDASDSEDTSVAERPVVIGGDSAVGGGRVHLLVWESTIRFDDQRFVVGRLDGATNGALQSDAAGDSYRALVENAPVPIFVSDETGHLRELNDKAERLTGRSRDELIGEKITTLHPADEPEYAVERCLTVRRSMLLSGRMLMSSAFDLSGASTSSSSGYHSERHVIRKSSVTMYFSERTRICSSPMSR